MFAVFLSHFLEIKMYSSEKNLNLNLPMMMMYLNQVFDRQNKHF